MIGEDLNKREFIFDFKELELFFSKDIIRDSMYCVNGTWCAYRHVLPLYLSQYKFIFRLIDVENRVLYFDMIKKSNDCG